jgi:hypothetical protein
VERFAVNVVYGPITDDLGHATDGVNAWATPADAVRRTQSRIRIDQNHDHRWVGEVVHLELRGASLWAVGEVADHVSPTVRVAVGDEVVRVEADYFWSPASWRNEDGEDVVFHSLSLTASPARIAAKPVAFLAGGFDRKGGLPLNHPDRDLIYRAAETKLRHRHGQPLVVHEEQPVRERHFHPHEVYELAEDAAWRNRPLRIRPASIIDVR